MNLRTAAHTRNVVTRSLITLLLLAASGLCVAAPPDLSKVIHSNVVERASAGEAVDVIVLLSGYQSYVGSIDVDDTAQLAAAQAQIQATQQVVLDQMAAYNFSLRHRFENILGFSGTTDAAGLEALAAMPEVQLIEEDGRAEAHLQQGIPLMNAITPRSTYDGTGLSIAIVDTGIDFDHSKLGGGGFPNSKVIGGYDFGDNDPNPDDCQGHGTACAGIAAGALASGPGDYIGGVAPNAKLYALKIVQGCGGSAAFSTIAAAWDWAVTHKNDDPNNPIKIISTSFGGGFYSSPCDSLQPTLAAAANNAVANGITLFGSSGNDTYTNGMGAPACVSSSLSVGAVYDADVGSKFFSVCTDLTTAADQVTCYSNSATFLDMLAPSNDAYTPAPGGGYTATFGGTSAASPYAAGAGAVLQDSAKSTTGSFLSPTQLKAALVNNGDPITDPRNGITKPRVNVGNAVQPPSAWTYCIKDVAYTAEYWVDLEYDRRVVRGQAMLSGPFPGFPAPIVGTFNVNPNELLFSVDYLDDSGLRFYLVNPGSWTGWTWAIYDDTADYYDAPRAATMEFCSSSSTPTSVSGDTGAAPQR